MCAITQGFFISKKKDYLCVRVFCLHVYSTIRGQKRASDLLRLELQRSVSYHVGVGNWTQVLWKMQPALLVLSHPSSPQLVGTLRNYAFFFFLFWDTVPLCSPGLLQTCDLPAWRIINVCFHTWFKMQFWKSYCSSLTLASEAQGTLITILRAQVTWLTIYGTGQSSMGHYL